MISTDTTSTTHNSKSDKSSLPLRQVSCDGLESILPDWYERLSCTWGEKVIVSEWEEEDESTTTGYRKQNGWKGKDLIHDKDASVYIPQYYVQYGSQNDNGATGLARGGVGTRLTGAVYFSERAESHKGFCHGGSMCSVMDDVIGWVSFMVTGSCQPWSGFTVQINTSLQKPIPVRTTLMVIGEIKRIERRKVFIEASLVDPVDDSQHAKAEGIVVLNRGVLPPEPVLESQESNIMSTD